METIEYFGHFLRNAGVPNFLVIGIGVIVIWLLISGLRKGLRKRKKDRSSEDDDNESEESTR
jgi:hypothetical protein